MRHRLDGVQHLSRHSQHLVRCIVFCAVFLQSENQAASGYSGFEAPRDTGFGDSDRRGNEGRPSLDLSLKLGGYGGDSNRGRQNYGSERREEGRFHIFVLIQGGFGQSSRQEAGFGGPAPEGKSSPFKNLYGRGATSPR
jgi:hypothetical protein